jgi:positive regulator of sigma E activity
LRYFIPLVVLALIFVVYAKIVISSGILLVTMVFTLPFALLVIQASFADIIVRQNEASDSAVIARLLSRLRPG